jgi:hypothetical protein
MFLSGLTPTAIWNATTRTLTDYGLPTTGESSGVTPIAVTAGLNVKGSYAQLIASTAAISKELILSMTTTAVTLFAVDISVGPAASEVVVIPNLIVQLATAVGSETFIFSTPFKIAAGSRIAARAQSTAANVINVGITVLE